MERRRGGEAHSDAAGLAARRARAAARSTAASTASASARKEAPPSVRATPRGWRMNSAASISSSSALICCDSGGCCICSFSAARVMWPSWAPATKERRWGSSIWILLTYGKAIYHIFEVCMTNAHRAGTSFGAAAMTALLAASLSLLMIFTALLSGIFGMAGGLILVGVLLVVMPLPQAMVLHAVTQMASNGWRALLWRQHIVWKTAAASVVGSLLSLGLW